MRYGKLRSRPSRHRVVVLASVVTGLALGVGPGCNKIDLSMGRHASLSRMAAGGSPNSGEIECWLTLEFKHYPDGVELRDVKVRFQSIALADPAEFDWSFIAANDKLAEAGTLAPNLAEAEVTDKSRPPPLGQPTMVRFPLRAKEVIEDAPATLYLEAELYWGGVKQHAIRRPIEHMYSHERGSED